MAMQRRAGSGWLGGESAWLTLLALLARPTEEQSHLGSPWPLEAAGARPEPIPQEWLSGIGR